MYVKEMKPLIDFVTTLDISELQCRKGYKGANLVHIGSYSQSVITLIINYCKENNIMTKIDKSNKDIKIYIDCIYERNDIYKIKDLK